MPPPRVRCAKVHSRQYEIIVDALESNAHLRNGDGEPHKLRQSWERLTSDLNAIGLGPVKSLPEWRTTLQNWKGATRRKARTIRDYGEETGDGPATRLMLTPVEERLMKAVGCEQLLTPVATKIECDDESPPPEPAAVQKPSPIRRLNVRPTSTTSSQSTANYQRMRLDTRQATTDARMGALRALTAQLAATASSMKELAASNATIAESIAAQSASQTELAGGVCRVAESMQSVVGIVQSLAQSNIAANNAVIESNNTMKEMLLAIMEKMSS